MNNATGGRTQLVGIFAGAAMLVFLFFLTRPLACLPTTALAAIIVVATVGFFDIAAIRNLWSASTRELLFSLATTAGVLIYGVLPGVFLAVVLSLLWLLSVSSRPHDAILGQPPGVEGFHDLKDYPEATTTPGLLIYRFDADVVFYNCDLFKERVQESIRKADTKVEWVLVDASPINVVDYTAMQMIYDFRRELAAQGIEVVFAGAKQSLARYFRSAWIKGRRERQGARLFPSVHSAIQAFERREPKEKSKD